LASACRARTPSRAATWISSAKRWSNAWGEHEQALPIGGAFNVRLSRRELPRRLPPIRGQSRYAVTISVRHCNAVTAFALSGGGR